MVCQQIKAKSPHLVIRFINTCLYYKLKVSSSLSNIDDAHTLCVKDLLPNINIFT